MESCRMNVVLSVSLALAAGCATAKEPETRTVRTTVSVPAPPERVLRAFLDSQDLGGWWKVSRSFVEEKPGGIWAITWDNYGDEKTQHAWVGVVEHVSPRSLRVGHLVAIEPDRPLFGPLRLEFVVSPEGEGTSLTVTHSGYGHGEHWDWAYDVVVQGWKHVLGDMQEWFRRGEPSSP